MADINIVAVGVADGIGIVLAIMMLAVRRWAVSNNKKENFLLRLMVIISIITCLSDFFSFLLDGVPGGAARFFCYACNFWLYLSNMIIGSMFFGLIVVHICNDGMPKHQKILVMSVDIIGVLVLFVNFFVPIVFSMDESNVYHREALFILFTCIQGLFIVDSLVFYLVTRKTNNKIKYFPVWQFIIPTIVGIVVQSCVYGISTINISIVIGINGIILGMYNESDIEVESLKQHEIDTKIIIEQKEQLEAQQIELERALKLAESSNNAKTTFLNNMSHDIRTPMNAILGYADIAYRHREEVDTVGDSLEKIKTSGKHLLNLINDVLEMSRIESGKLVLANAPVDIRTIINGVEKMSLVLAIPKSIDFKINVSEIKNPYIRADELHLNEILINLVSNAVKYTPDGGKVSLNVSEINQDNGFVRFRFEIKDNGIGMSEEFQKHLFETFTRDETNTVHNIEGTGLGLSIVKKIVDLSNGNISVQSKVNEGSSFAVELPFEIADEKEKESLINEKSKKETSLKAVNLKGRKVLLVEDNEMNREIAKDILTEVGLDVDIAEDGAIAVKKFKEFGPEVFDIILMDIQMPIMNGFEATKVIRALPNGKEIPIIALSANAFKEDIDKSLEAGMNAHVAKPINIKVLLDTMQSLLEE